MPDSIVVLLFGSRSEDVGSNPAEENEQCSKIVRVEYIFLSCETSQVYIPEFKEKCWPK